MKNGKTFQKEEIDKIMADVDRKLESFIKEGNYKDVLLMMGNIGKYSITNQIYILLQKPDAITVNGVRGWNFLGRKVRKGEKGIKIIAPIKETIKEETNKKDDDGKEKKEKVIKTFKPSYVFDISQTEGKEIRAFKIDEKSTVKDKELIINGIMSVLLDEGYSLRYVSKEELGEGCYGLCNHLEKQILLLDDMSDLQHISTLVHECAHALAHNPYKENFKGLNSIPSRDIKEVEAESIACVVCSHLGLNTENFNFAYITGWADGDISKFRKNVDVISYYSLRLIKSIDASLAKKEKTGMNILTGKNEESLSQAR